MAAKKKKPAKGKGKAGRINGFQWHRALKFALAAAPVDKGHRLAHVVLLGDEMVAADGRRWHVGLIPDAERQKPIAVALESAKELLLGLDYAAKMAKRHGGGFFVGQDLDRVVIYYADRQITHDLVRVDVRHMPDVFLHPVPDDAPPLAGPHQIDADHVADATSWKGRCSVQFKGAGGDQPVRVEITHQEDLVGLAFILPMDRGEAQLVPDEPLLQRTLPADQRLGQSVLDLQLDLHLPATAGVTSLQIGDAKVDTTGIDDAASLVVKAPCGVKGHDPDGEPMNAAAGQPAIHVCFPCTMAAVTAAREDQQKQAAKVSDLDKARAKKKQGKGPGPKGKPRK